MTQLKLYILRKMADYHVLTKSSMCYSCHGVHTRSSHSLQGCFVQIINNMLSVNLYQMECGSYYTRADKLRKIGSKYFNFLISITKLKSIPSRKRQARALTR